MAGNKESGTDLSPKAKRMTENDLVKKILQNAVKEAKKLIEDAETNSLQRLADATANANERKKKALADAERKLKQRSEELTLAVEVDNIKQKINTKQAIMSQVFDGIRANIEKADAAKRQKMVTALTKKYGKPADRVSPAADGGIIISGKNYDIDLSLSVLLDDLRDAIELDIAKMLF
jgi:vacuolar-type H+-ATPase subunit E/Vma4